jgi:hypothetical protein
MRAEERMAEEGYKELGTELGEEKSDSEVGLYRGELRNLHLRPSSCYHPRSCGLDIKYESRL